MLSTHAMMPSRAAEPTSGVTRIIRRGALCLPEQPHAPADSCVSKSKASRVALASDTASLASKGPAVASRRWPVSLPRSKSSVLPPDTSASGTKEPGSRSGSAHLVERSSFTPKTAPMGLRTSPWGPLPTLTFRRLDVRSTKAAGTRGFSCHQARQHSTKIPLDIKSRPCRKECEMALGSNVGHHLTWRDAHACSLGR
jgi:hypothetical protein